MSTKRIAVIGAGPVGLEAALYGTYLGHDLQIYERGRVGENIRRWGHVSLFSPERMNRSQLAVLQLDRADLPLSDDERYLTGRQFVEQQLEPLAHCEPLAGRIHEGCTVIRVGRERIGKSDLVGGPRDRYPFRLLLEQDARERIVNADVVLDCSGTYGHHNWMGSGNLPAPGELRLKDRIAYTLEDIAGRHRDRYAGKHVLLVGSGHSAATALDALIRLPGTQVLWITKADRERPHELIPDDPLPERARLSGLANGLAAGSHPQVTYRRATVVERVEERDGGFGVTLRSTDREQTVTVDRILAHVGYSPDNSLYRELQVHECYATFGPIRLAAALLGDSSSDCLAQSARGAEVLENPEPGFFILGAKSYGKNSRFLIRIGLEQVREVYSLIEDRPELNLYASEGETDHAIERR